MREAARRSPAALAAAPRRVIYPRGRAVEFCPWIRTESLETHILISDLVHHLGGEFGQAAPAWKQRLRDWAQIERVADQYAADGTLLATYARQVAPDEVWRLSLGRAEAPSLEYGMLVFRGPYALCHFQIVGPRTFATCHSRRNRLEEPPRPRVRWVPRPANPGVLLSLLLMNCGADANRITLSRLASGRKAHSVTVTLPRLGCRLVCLNEALSGDGEGDWCDRFLIESTSPYDYYTIMENGGASAETLSIQHVK
ncbi:hypothetical protein [Nitrospira sp. Kam-Ns4a]